MKLNWECIYDEKVFIYTRDDAKKGYWYYYFIINGHPHRKSTGETDEKRAKHIAIKKFMEAEANPDQHDRKAMTFKAVAERWLKFHETHSDIVNKRKAVEKFFVPYFHVELKLADIADLRQAHLTDYLAWRRSYHTEGPGSQQTKTTYRRRGKALRAATQSFGVPKNVTVNRESQNLNQILNFAVKEGYIHPVRCPKMDMLPDDGDVRPFFTAEQCGILLATARERIGQGHSDKIQAERQLAYDYIVTVYYTGLRPHEAHGLAWQDINLEGRVLRVRKGKTGHRFVAIPDQGLIDHLTDMQERRMAAAGDKFNDAQLVFADADGKPVKSFKTAFEGLIKACGFVSPDGKNFSFYGLRHHRATAMIEDDTPDGFVAKNLGTSRKMLDKYYDRTNAQTYL